jgi:hypothetical protein
MSDEQVAVPGGPQEPADKGDVQKGGWRRWMGLGLAGLGLALVAGFASYTMSLLTTIEEQGEIIRNLRGELSEAKVLALLLSADHTEIFRLSGPSGEDGGKGAMVWNRATGEAFLHITGLTPADTVTKYNVWVIGEGTPSSIASFRVPPDGVVSLFVGRLTAVDGQEGALVVTTDPDGSARFGSGTMVLAGSIPPRK